MYILPVNTIISICKKKNSFTNKLYFYEKNNKARSICVPHCMWDSEEGFCVCRVELKILRRRLLNSFFLMAGLICFIPSRADVGGNQVATLQFACGTKLFNNTSIDIRQILA